MLEEIYSTDELIDNLRIIYRGKTKDEKFRLIRITNDYGEMVMMPISSKTMYDMFVIINDKVYHKFMEEINKDPIKKQQFFDMKFHDSLIDELIDENMKESVSKIDKLRNAFHEGFLFNRNLMKEFEVHKKKSIIKDTIKEENGLLTNYYISNYITIYNDIVFDFERILIDSLNTYTKTVTGITEHSYPLINDFGTAHDYFYKIYSNSPMSQNKDVRLGRLYYRKTLNENMIAFIKETCDKMIRRSLIIEFIIILSSASLLLISQHALMYYFLIYMTILSSINTLYRVKEKYSIIRRFNESIEREDRVLSDLAEAEQDTIKNWYGI